LIKFGSDKNELGWEKTPDEYVKRLSDILMKCLDKLKETGSMFVNLGETYKDKQCLGVIDRLTVEMMNRGVRLVDKIIWNKPSSKPVGRQVQRFYPGYEVILHFSKSKDYYFDNFKIQRDKKLRVARGCKEKGLKKLNYHIPNPHGYFRNVIDPETLTNVITLQINKNRTKHIESEEYHPATFSMDLPLLPLLVSVPKSENSVVFDPFMGSGSTGVTALRLGFKFVGCELYEKNIKTSRRMLSENQAEFDENKIDDIINDLIFGDNDESIQQAA
jgi:DNA modification methylase